MSLRIFRTEEAKVGEFPVQLQWKHVSRMAIKYDPRNRRFLLILPLTKEREEGLDFAKKNLLWMRKVQTRSAARPPHPLPYKKDMAEFAKKLPERMDYWSKRMGLPVNNVTLKMMKSRWGSCNQAKRSISISLMLANREPACVDYVIVHELAHLVHPNHSADFWALVEKYIPNWRECRDTLRR